MTTSEPYINLKRFGTIGKDDSVLVNKAIQEVIHDTKLPRTLYFPPAVYNFDAPIICQNWNGTDYDYFSIVLQGQPHTHFTADAYMTRLRFHFKDSFGIGFQKCRSSAIIGLSIEGQFNPDCYNKGAKVFFSTPYDEIQDGSRDNRQSPYAGVVMDPFMQDDESYIKKENRYPIDGYKGTGSNGGSSGLFIGQSQAKGFVVNVMNSPTGFISNGENLFIEKCRLEKCKVVYASGSGQNKNNFIRNTTHWDNVHTVLDAGSYGQGSGLVGNLPYVDGMNIAGNVVRLFNSGSNFTTSLSRVTSESILQIGRSEGLGMIRVSDSDFCFEQASGVNAEYHLHGGNVNFQNCTIKHYDDQFNKRMTVGGNAQNISFQDCRLDLPPLIQSEFRGNMLNVSFRNCFSGKNKEGIGSSSSVVKDFAYNHYMAAGEYFQEKLTGETLYSRSGRVNQITTLYNGYAKIEGNVLTIPTAGFSVDDCLIDIERGLHDTDTGEFITYPYIGMVESIGDGFITLKNIPRNLVDDVNYVTGIVKPEMIKEFK